MVAAADDIRTDWLSCWWSESTLNPVIHPPLVKAALFL